MAQRLKPAAVLTIGLLVLGLNVVMLIKAGRFFPFGTILGCAMILAAGFGVAVGEPEDPYGNRPMWFTVGIVASAVVGLIVGLLLNLELAAE